MFHRHKTIIISQMQEARKRVPPNPNTLKPLISSQGLVALQQNSFYSPYPSLKNMLHVGSLEFRNTTEL